MASIRIRRRHTDNQDDARKKIEDAIGPQVAKFGLKKTWDGDTLKVSGKGVKGTLTVGDGDININMKLGMPASMFSSKIENELNSELNKAFG